MRYILSIDDNAGQRIVIPVRRIKAVILDVHNDNYSISIYHDEQLLNPVRWLNKSKKDAESLYYKILDMIAEEA